MEMVASRRIPLLEATHPIGTTAWLEINMHWPQMAAFAAFRIRRVGVELHPLSYAEFIVRSTGQTSINTRAELTTQEDCVVYHNLQSGKWIKWYKPTDALHRGWQDMVSSGAMTTGLFIMINGQNQLIAGTGGIIGNLVVEVEFRGFTTV